MMAPPSCAKGPIQRERAGSKSDVNFGTAPPAMPATLIGKAFTEAILSRASDPYAVEAAAAALRNNLRREIGIVHFTAMIETCSTIGALPFALRLRSIGGSGATVVRVGGAPEKYLPYTPFILANSPRSSAYTLLETTFEKSRPASCSPSSRLRIVWRTW